MGSWEEDIEFSMPQLDKAEAEVKKPEMGVEDEELYLQIPLVGSTILPMTLKAALELGILEILTKGCAAHSADMEPVMMTAYDIALQLPTKNPQAAATMLDRMLGLLASFNIVRCDMETKEKEVRRYGPPPMFKWLTKNEDGSTTANLVLLMMEQVIVSSGHYLKEVVLEGGTAFDKAHGMTIYEYMDTDPRFSRVFNEAMKSNSTFTVNKMLEAYQGFKSVHVLVDVGGGVGATLGMIISKYPHIKGINLDLLHAISNAPPLPGVVHVVGDMFDCIPNGDAILLKWILHNYSDEYVAKILKNCNMALPNEGKVIVVDYILPVHPKATTSSQGAFLFDIMMMMQHDGRERTKGEFETIAKDAGFTQVETTYFWGEMGLIELRK